MPVRFVEVDAGNVRRPPANRLRERRRDDDGRGVERRHRPARRRATAARAVGFDRQRRRGADHPPHQCAADAGRQGQRVGHSHRAVREPHDGAVPHRRRAARGAAIEARRRVARRVARQGHVEARYRGEAPAARRPHLAADRGPRRRRARRDDPVGPRRARRAALARQASGPAHANEPRHGRQGPSRDGRAHPSAARHPARHGPNGLGQDDDVVRGARAHQRPHAQHPDRRGSDRVPHRRHRPDTGEHEGRNDVRARACARSCGRTPTS